MSYPKKIKKRALKLLEEGMSAEKITDLFSKQSEKLNLETTPVSRTIRNWGKGNRNTNHLFADTPHDYNGGRKGRNAEIIFKINDDYNSWNLRKTMKKLYKFKLNHGENWVNDFVKLRLEDNSPVEEEDDARGKFSLHFLTIQNLLKSGDIDEEHIKNLIPDSQIDFLLNVIEPLEAGINKRYDDSTFRLFEKMYRKELLGYKFEP